MLILYNDISRPNRTTLLKVGLSGATYRTAMAVARKFGRRPRSAKVPACATGRPPTHAIDGRYRSAVQPRHRPAGYITATLPNGNADTVATRY